MNSKSVLKIKHPIKSSLEMVLRNPFLGVAILQQDGVFF